MDRSLFIVFLSGFLLISVLNSCTQKVQGVVQPGYEWHDKDHMAPSISSYSIKFHRTGFDAREMGELEIAINHSADTAVIVRNVERAGSRFVDTLVVQFPDLMPISFVSHQTERIHRYSVSDGMLKGVVNYAGVEDLEYSHRFQQPFFDIASLGFVLGGVNHKSLEGYVIKFFDSESNEFTSFTVNSVSRETIKTATGNSFDCNLFKGKINQVNTSVWIDRNTGQLIKTHTEMPANMAMEMRLK